MSRARVDDGRREVKVTDPVCGMQVDLEARRPGVHSSVACSDEFAVDPAKYSRRWREPGFRDMARRFWVSAVRRSAHCRNSRSWFSVVCNFLRAPRGYYRAPRTNQMLTPGSAPAEGGVAQSPCSA